MNGIHYLLRPKDEDNKESKKQPTAFTNGNTVLNGHAKTNSIADHQTPRASLRLRFVNSIYDTCNYINYQISHSIGKYMITNNV